MEESPGRAWTTRCTGTVAICDNLLTSQLIHYKVVGRLDMQSKGLGADAYSMGEYSLTMSLSSIMAAGK